MLSNLNLLERSRNMIAALQWAGVETITGGCETCGPDKENKCPVCDRWEREYSRDYRSKEGFHHKDCELWTLLQELNDALK